MSLRSWSVEESISEKSQNSTGISDSSTNSSIIDWSITDYVIDVETSDRPNASTTSNIYLQMYGQGGLSDAFRLEIGKSKKNKTAFQRGQLDQFIFFKSTSYGYSESIKIWHDSSGVKPFWHFAQATISDTKLGLTFRFACHRWLAENMDDGKICREVRCIEMGEGPKNALQITTGVEKVKKFNATSIGTQ